MTKSRIRNILALVLTLALCLGGIVGLRNARADLAGISATKTTFAVTDTSDLSASFDAAGVGAGTVTWTSSNSAVVSVPAANTGTSITVTGVAPGTATVTATYADATATPAVNTVKTIDLTVTLKGTVTVSPATQTLTVGETVNMAVAGNSLDTTTYPGTYAWSSSNTAAATVDANGKVTAVAAGTANITATFTGTNPQVTATTAAAAVITVNAAPATPTLSIGANPTSLTSANQASTVTVTLNNPNSSFVSNNVVAWSINDKGATSTNVAQFSPAPGTNLTNNVGLAQIIAKASGTTVVTATLTASDGTKLSKSIEIVVSLPNPTLGLSSDVQTLTSRNQRSTLTATLTNANAATPATSAVKWWCDSADSNGNFDGKADSKVVSIASSEKELRAGVATAYVKAVNNGTVRVYCQTASGVTTYHTIYVSGLAFLPQTGQDMTWVYVLGGACVALIAAAGIVNARRKKLRAE